MDFLDPHKKRRYQARLIIGYLLVAITIGLGAVILVNAAFGYGIDTKTGQIIQNGLLFIDSKPGGADIYLNDKLQHSNTSARLVLPAGSYNLTLKKAGYRDWQRNFTLDEHTIGRYVYPLLFPIKPRVNTLKVYDGQPAVITQSPDRRWLLIQSSASAPDSISFDEYDTANPTRAQRGINLAATLLTQMSAQSRFRVVEWSNDNNHLLLEHKYDGDQEFIVLDRLNPDKSINVNRLFKIAPNQVALRDKKIGQLYLLDKKNQLRLGTVRQGQLGPIILKQVLAFKSHGARLLSYVTDAQSAAGNVQARIWDNGATYQLSTFKSGGTYLLDAAQFQGHWYYVVGNDTARKTNIYKDPLDRLKDPTIAKAVPFVSFRDIAANKVSFSTNTRFIGIQSRQRFGVYDIELQDRYIFTLKKPLSGPMQWMDGHRWVGNSQGQFLAMDFDSTNQQTLLTDADDAGGYFSRNFNQLYVLSPITDGEGSVVLQLADMRAGVDLPKTASP